MNTFYKMIIIVYRMMNKEYFWIRTFKTYYPHGFSIEEIYYGSFLYMTYAKFSTFFRGIRAYYVKCTNTQNWF